MCLCFREACESALKEKHLAVSQKEGLSGEDPTSLSVQLDALGGVFRKAAEDDMPTDVSTWLVSNYIFIKVTPPPPTRKKEMYNGLLVEYSRCRIIFAVE